METWKRRHVMKDKFTGLFIVGIVMLLAGNSFAAIYNIWDTWGGTWADADHLRGANAGARGAAFWG